jgi:predicted transcriptional regulator
VKKQVMLAAIQPQLKPLLITLVKTHPERLRNGLSLRELGDLTYCDIQTVRRHIRALAALGVIQYQPGKNRGKKTSFDLSPMAFHIAGIEK